MPKKKKEEAELNAKQRLFCKEYIEDFIGGAAAGRAGYSPKTAYSQASRLLKRVKVTEYIDSLIEEKLKLEKGSLRYKVLKGVSEIAFDEISIEVVRDKNGEPITLRLNDRLKALEMLGKYGNLWNDNKLELSGKLETENKTVNINTADLTDDEARELFFQTISKD